MKRTDWIGMILACACVVHCLAMPLVLVYLPVLGMNWLADSRVHYVLLGAGLALGGLSFLPGYRIHSRAWIPALALVGLGTMGYAAMYQEDGCCRRPSVDRVDEIVQTNLVLHERLRRATVAYEATMGDTSLPECCRNGQCATARRNGTQEFSAAAGAVPGMMPLLPRSGTPIGASLLLIAHILNLRFRRFRVCAAACCANKDVISDSLKTR